MNYLFQIKNLKMHNKIHQLNNASPVSHNIF